MGRRGVNACVCLRGAAALLRPGRLQLVRGGAISAERPFPRSEQGRRKAGGDLASPQKGFGELSGAGGNPFPLLPQAFVAAPHPNPLRARTLGWGKDPLGSHSALGPKVPDVAQGCREGGGPGAQTAPPGAWVSPLAVRGPPRHAFGLAPLSRRSRSLEVRAGWGPRTKVTCPSQDPGRGAQECPPDRRKT